MSTAPRNSQNADDNTNPKASTLKLILRSIMREIKYLRMFGWVEYVAMAAEYSPRKVAYIIIALVTIAVWLVWNTYNMPVFTGLAVTTAAVTMGINAIWLIYHNRNKRKSIPKKHILAH